MSIPVAPVAGFCCSSILYAHLILTVQSPQPPEAENQFILQNRRTVRLPQKSTAGEAAATFLILNFEVKTLPLPVLLLANTSFGSGSSASLKSLCHALLLK